MKKMVWYGMIWEKGKMALWWSAYFTLRGMEVVVIVKVVLYREVYAK